MTVGHAGPVLAIYQAGIDEGNATFETRAPGWAEFSAARLSDHRYVALDEQPPAVLAPGDDPPEPPAVLARGDDPPEPPAVLARGDDPPEPPAVLARGDDPPEPPAVLGW